jgi:hypothetical protein
MFSIDNKIGLPGGQALRNKKQILLHGPIAERTRIITGLPQSRRYDEAPSKGVLLKKIFNPIRSK